VAEKGCDEPPTEGKKDHAEEKRKDGEEKSSEDKSKEMQFQDFKKKDVTALVYILQAISSTVLHRIMASTMTNWRLLAF